MDIKFDRNNGKITWEYNGKKINIIKSNVLYAFEHGNNKVMVKERIEGHSSFSLYDETGVLIFDYQSNSKELHTNSGCISVDLEKIISADYDEIQNVLVILEGNGTDNILSLYENSGKKQGTISQPKELRFISLSNDKGRVDVSCRGLDAKYVDSFGRNDWCFEIDYESLNIKSGHVIE